VLVDGEEPDDVSERTARRRRRQLAAARHYRSLWNEVPRPLQALVVLVLADRAGVSGHLLQLGQALVG
jgi:hypothetical protein